MSTTRRCLSAVSAASGNASRPPSSPSPAVQSRHPGEGPALPKVCATPAGTSTVEPARTTACSPANRKAQRPGHHMPRLVIGVVDMQRRVLARRPSSRPVLYHETHAPHGHARSASVLRRDDHRCCNHAATVHPAPWHRLPRRRTKINRMLLECSAPLAAVSRAGVPRPAGRPGRDHLLVIARVTGVPYVTDSGEPLIRFRHQYLPDRL